MATEQPAPNTAPEPAKPQAPAQEPVQQPAAQAPAEPTPNFFDSLDEESKTYLKGQGINNADDLGKADNVEKLLKHNLSLKKTAADTANELARIKTSVTGEAAPDGAQPAPTASQQPSTTSLDPVTAFNLATSLALQFPALKEDLTNGSFYKNLEASGRSLVDANGAVNLSAIQSFGSEQQKLRELEQKVSEFEKPNPNAIPDANPSSPAQPAADTPMTHAIALAIMSQDTSHARYNEAVQFLQSEVKSK